MSYNHKVFAFTSKESGAIELYSFDHLTLVLHCREHGLAGQVCPKYMNTDEFFTMSTNIRELE